MEQVVKDVDLLAAFRGVLSADGPEAVIRETLHAIRELMSVDTAFWSVWENDGLRMQSLIGLGSPELHQRSFVPAGQGVGGRVIETGEPVTVVDYAQFAGQVPELRILLDQEELVSVAAVPVRSESGVVAVLYVLSRDRRAFSDSELRLMMGMASLARTIQEQVREHQDRATRIHLLELEVTQSERERAAVNELGTAILRGDDVGRAVALAGDALGTQLTLRHVQESTMPGPSTDAQVSEPDGDVMVELPRELPIPGNRNTSLVVGRDSEVAETSLQAVCVLIGLHFARQRSSVETEIRLTESLIRASLEGSREELQAIWRQAALVGIDLATPRAVIVLGSDRRLDRELVDRVAREVRARSRHGQVTTFEGDVIVLWPVAGHASLQKLRRDVEDLIRSCRPRVLVAGIGPVCTTADDYPAAVREARFARQVAEHSTLDRDVATSDDLGMYRIFAHVVGVDSLRKSIGETLGPLLEDGNRDSAQLLYTLRVYLERDRRLAEAARTLHVHVNTLRYRIERISKVLHIDLDDPEARFFTLLALRLSNVVDPLRTARAPSVNDSGR